MPASTVPADVITKFTGFCTTKFNEAKTAADGDLLLASNSI